MSVEVVVSKTVCWTDSLLALWWIKRTDKIWKVWVENRVRKIREKVDRSSLRHIPGEMNPADIATRECRPKVLPQLWFHAPEFLKSPNQKWPVPVNSAWVGGEVTLLEVRNSVLEWLKFGQHFIIQDGKFQKQKHSLNLYFDENDKLRSQTRINQIKGVLLEESQPVPFRSNSYFTEHIVLKCHNEVKH